MYIYKIRKECIYINLGKYSLVHPRASFEGIKNERSILPP